MRITNILLVISFYLMSGATLLAQTESPSPQSTPTTTANEFKILLEDKINIVQALLLVPTPKASQAKVNFQNWNSQFGDMVVNVASRLPMLISNGVVFSEYNTYKFALFEKLRIFEEAQIASYLSLEGNLSSRSSRLVALNKAFARLDRDIMNAKAAPSRCDDKSPAGLCWCELESRFPNGIASVDINNTTYEKHLTACYQLNNRVGVIGPSFKRGCHITILDNSDMTPSVGCTCKDISPSFESEKKRKERGIIEICIPSAHDEIRRKGVVIRKCSPENGFGPIDIIQMLPEDICEPVLGICGPTRSLLSNTNIANLPPTTRLNLSSSINDIDARLASSAPNDCGTVPVIGTNPTEPVDPGHGGENDQWLSPPVSLRNIYPTAQQYLSNSDVGTVKDDNSFVSPPIMDRTLLEIIRRYPTTMVAANRRAKLVSAAHKISAYNRIIDQDITLLDSVRDYKRLVLLSIKELAAQSRIYEEKKLRALYIKSGFNVVSSALALVPATAIASVPVALVGSLVSTIAEPRENPTMTVARGAEEVEYHTKHGLMHKVVHTVIDHGAPIAERATGAAASYAGTLRGGTQLALRLTQVQTALSRHSLPIVGVGAVMTAATMLHTYHDIDGFVQRDVALTNPYELLMRQNELYVRKANNLMSKLRSEISQFVALRDQELSKFKTIYCTDAQGTRSTDPECS